MCRIDCIDIAGCSSAKGYNSEHGDFQPLYFGLAAVIDTNNHGHD